MINSIVGGLAKTLYGKQLLQIVDKGNSVLTGHRSEIIITLIVIVAILQHFGVVPNDTAKQVEVLLTGMLPVTLAEKCGNALDQANKILPQPPIKPIQ